MANNNDNKNIKFTGDPVAFDGVEGKRDPKTGKGRFDLIPEEVFGPLFDRVHKLETTEPYTVDCTPASILNDIANENMLDAIIKITILKYYNTDSAIDAMCCQIEAGAFLECCWDMFLDLAIHFQKGAEHYGERNCQKGIPLWSFKDSAMRHAAQTFAGKTDEPHIISVIWNCWMAAWTVITSNKKDDEDKSSATSTEHKIIKNKRPTYGMAIKILLDRHKNAVPKFYQDKYILTSDHKLQPSHPGEEWKPAKQQVDVIIHSDSEIPQDQRDKMKKFCMQMRDKLTKLNFEFGDGKDKWDKLIDEMAENAKEAGIPWPPKEPEIVPDTRDDNSRTMSSDSPEVEEKKSDIDEMKKIIDELVHLSNELEIPVVTAQQTSYTREEVEAIKKEAADKAIEDFLKDSADDDYYGKRMTPLCRCSTDSLIGELHKRLVLINKSENIVKLNFVTNNREKLGKLTHLIDSIKRCDVDTKTTVDTDEIQRIIHQLREEMKKAYNVFTDTDGKYVRVFFNQLRPGMNNMIAMWNSIALLLNNEKTPEQ